MWCWGATPPGRPQADGLLYHTDFEPGTRIAPVNPSNKASNDELLDPKKPPQNATVTGLRFNYEGGDATMRYARIEEESGNRKNRVLHFWANTVNAHNYSKTRIQADVRGVKAGLKEFYQSVRFYLPKDMALLNEYPPAITWLTIMEVWNNSPNHPFPFRVTVGLRKPAGKGQLRFHAEAQNIDQTNPDKAKFIVIWSQLNEQLEVPFGKWMTLEYYLAEGDAKTGRFFMAVTPQGGERKVLFDITHYTHHTKDPAPDGFTAWNPMKLYTSRPLTDYMRGQGKALELLWDDLYIWKDRKPSTAGAGAVPAKK